MIEIYNEAGYIQNILQYGISSSWTRDIRLLARYFKREGSLTYKEAQDNILNKLKLASKRKNNPINYLYGGESETYACKVIRDAWKNGEPIREISKIEISKEVLDWFLKLGDNFKVDKEFITKEKAGFEHCGLKASIKKPIITWKRTKFLFTIYVWSMIQKTYNPDGYVYHNMDRYEQRFKREADIASGFNMFAEEVLLHDLGFIKLLNNDKGIVAKFIQDYDVFQIPVTEENKVIIESDEIGEGDLYYPGLWLEKQKMGSFVCQRCGKEIPHYSKSKGEMGRKYCKECAYKVANKITYDINIKFVDKICVKCKNIYIASKLDHKSTMCPTCREQYIKDQSKKRMNKMRAKAKNNCEEVIIL